MGFVQGKGGGAVSEHTNEGTDSIKLPTRRAVSKPEDGNGRTLYFSLKFCIGNYAFLLHVKYNTIFLKGGADNFLGILPKST